MIEIVGSHPSVSSPALLNRQLLSICFLNVAAIWCKRGVLLVGRQCETLTCQSWVVVSFLLLCESSSHNLTSKQNIL